MKPNTNGPRTNENIRLSATVPTVTANLTMAPAGIITGVCRLPNGTILTPTLDGMNMMNVNINANNNDSNTWGSAQVDKDGSFRIEGLLPGNYDLQTNGWGNSYIYATAYMKNVVVVAGSTTTVEIPLHKGVKVHPTLSADLPADIKASLTQDPATGMQSGNLSIVFTPASISLNAKNMDTIFQMGKGGSQDNTINYWGGNFQDVSLEPGAYNFYLVYEKQFPQFDTNYAKVIIGRAKNVVIDLSKQTDQYAQNGSTMNMVSCQFIPVTVSIGANRLSGTYAGVNTIRDADMQVIASNFNNFISYVPRVTVMDMDGNIMATGMVTPTPEIIRQTGLDGGGSTADPVAIKRIQGYMNKMSYGINYLPAKDKVKLIFTTPNYPPLLRTVAIPGSVNVDMDNDAGAGQQITGALRNSGGQPVADAIIRIRGRLLDRTVKSQTDGTFLIPGLAMGVYRLTVTAAGYALAADKVVISNEGKISNFTLIPCAGSITGTVYSQQFPYPLIVSGANVVAYDDTANGLDPAKELPIYEVSTDNNGIYTISPVIEGHTYKVALVVPGKAVQVYAPSPAVPASAGSTATGIDFTYKSKAPKVDIIARPNTDGSVTLQGSSPKKLVSLTARFNEGTAYSETAAADLTVSQIGDKTYSVTLADKTKAYAVRFTINDGGATNTADVAYDPRNLAQSIASIDQQAVASGDVVLDSQGNDTSGIYISPGSVTLADGSVPQLTINKENHVGSSFAAGMDADALGGDIYHVDMDLNGSQQNEDKTMTLTLGYDPSLVGDGTDSLSVRRYNETTHQWEPILAIPMVDPISGTVSIEIPSIANATGSNPAPKRASMARFNGSEYKLNPAQKAVAASNQTGVFVVSKTPARLAFTGDIIEVFNVPNPFNLQSKTVALNRGGSLGQITTKGTVIRFAVPASMGLGVKTRFRVYNIAGEMVRELNANDILTGGVDGGYYYYIDWDGCNGSGSKCASGVYLCVAEIGTQKKVIKMALIK